MTGAPHKKGFTLVELLVSLTVFMTAALLITEIFILTNRAQRRGLAGQKIQSDIRVISSLLSENIRTSTIDYAFYGGTIVNPVEDTLALRDPDGNPVRFRKESVTCSSVTASPCLQISRDGLIWSTISSRDVILEVVKFYISPTTDPFAVGSPPNVQPSVTISLKLKGTSPVLESQNPLNIQLTALTRTYQR